MDGQSLTPQEIKLQQLKELLPEAFSEGKIDWEKLRATLGDDVTFNNERYVLNWAGKSDAFKVLQAPSTSTLVPSKEESINFDETENIFIEGENLEVLKVLQKSYFGKVKMIYIDPPYNTGNDSFIYPDKFSETKEEYQKRVGDKDEEGYMTIDGMFRKNKKENGQYHSNWLNMMMPRLYLAKNLLRDDGVIFVSIDENEVHNLRLLMNEIFGEENYSGEIVWKNSSKNDQAYISIQHEYILSFVKSKSNNNGEWKEKKEGLEEIYKAFAELRKKYNDNWEAIHKSALDWYKQFNESNPISSSKHYSWLDERGVYFAADISGPNFGQYRYDVIHPVTGKICKEPASGWRFPKDTLRQRIKDGFIHFGKDETTVPNNKVYLKDAEFQSLTSVKYRDGRVASKKLNALMDGNLFTNPKDTDILKILFKATNLNSGDIVLDFFSGSCSTAYAVMELNQEIVGNRKYICVQLPELCDEKSDAYKAGYKTIADIAKDRIRRAAKKIQKEIEAENKKKKGQLDFDSTTPFSSGRGVAGEVDLGFKVLKLADSNFKQWQQIEGKNAAALEEQMKLFVDPVAEHAQTENMVYELLLKSGKDLNSILRQAQGYIVVNDNELVFMLEKASEVIVAEIVALKPKKVIALDRLFRGKDQLKTNTALQMKDAHIEFKTI